MIIMKNWKHFLDELPEDIADNLLKFIFEEDVAKVKKELVLEFDSIKFFIEYLLIGII